MDLSFITPFWKGIIVGLILGANAAIFFLSLFIVAREKR